MTRLLLCTAALTGAALIAPGVAAAGELTAFKDACAAAGAGRLAPDAVLAAVMTKAGTPWSPAVITAYQNTLSPGHTPAEVTLAAFPDTVVREALIVRLTNIIALGPGAPEDGVSAVAVAGNPRELAERYLDGNFTVLTVTCAVPDDAGGGGGGGGGGGASGDVSLVIGGDISDLSGAPIGDRGFANFSYIDDQGAGAESIDADIVLGVGPVTAGDVLWTPYIAYQRRTTPGKELNDLTFGATGLWRGRGFEARWSGSYETDDDFESRVYRAAFDLEFPSWTLCRSEEDAEIICRLGLRADYAEIDDPGAKTGLVGVEDYFRAGGWMRLSYARPIEGDAWIRLTFDYDVMEALDGDVGRAERGRIAFDLLPSKSSRFKFGLSYENGEDITSLVTSEVFKATLGFRY